MRGMEREMWMGRWRRNEVEDGLVMGHRVERAELDIEFAEVGGGPLVSAEWTVRHGSMYKT